MLVKENEQVEVTAIGPGDLSPISGVLMLEEEDRLTKIVLRPPCHSVQAHTHKIHRNV